MKINNKISLNSFGDGLFYVKCKPKFNSTLVLETYINLYCQGYLKRDYFNTLMGLFAVEGVTFK